MKVSLYPHIKETKTAKNVNIEQILLNIQNGFYQDICLPIMSEKDKATRQLLKQKVPYFTAGGTFEQRKNEGLLEHSGLIAIDFDDIPENLNHYIALVNADEYTFATFKSISHTGFCALVKIDSLKHKEAFEGLSNYYYQMLKIPIDQACKDVSRPRYVSYDPDLYHNPTSKVFKLYPKKETKAEQRAKKINYIHTQDKFEYVLKQIDKDITGDYSQWRNIGFAIASKFGQAGEEYFHHISGFSPVYDVHATTKQYKYCCRPHSGGISISTFYYYAKTYGYNISLPNEDKIAKIAHYAKSGGRSKESAKEILALEGIEANDAVIDAVFSSDTFTPPAEDDDKKLKIEDVELWLSTNYKIRKNKITRFYENYGRELETEDLNSIYISAKKVFDKLSRDIFDTIIFSNFTPQYDPIRDYLATLEWDGVDRLTALCETITSDTGTFEYRHDLLRCWLLGIIESVFTEDANVLQLIFAGKQNTGKSVFFKRLLPEPLKGYIGLSQLDKGKDDELLMCQKLIILDDEFSGKSKLDAKLIKRLLSAPYFDLREPYGKKNIRLRRIASLCATSNEIEILNDPTGNRRNIVFEVVGKFNYSAYNALDKEQLFAQLVALHKEGFKSELTDSQIALIENYTADKHGEVSIEAEMVKHFFEAPEHAGEQDFYTSSQIKNIIETNSVQRLSVKKLGMELKRLGYIRFQKSGQGFGYRISMKHPNLQRNDPNPF